MTWLIVIILAGCVLLLLRSRGRVYKAIFAAEHYIEVARGLQKVKEAATNGITDDTLHSPEDDLRVLKTSVNLVIYYTITPEPDGAFTHHSSVSMVGGVTPHAVGERFIIYVATLFGIDLSRAALLVSEYNVFHMEFVSNQVEQELFDAHKVEIPSTSNLQTISQEIQRLREGVRFEPMVTGIRN